MLFAKPAVHEYKIKLVKNLRNNFKIFLISNTFQKRIQKSNAVLFVESTVHDCKPVNTNWKLYNTSTEGSNSPGRKK